MFNQLFQGEIDAYILIGGTNRRYVTKLETSFGCAILTPNKNHFITDFRYSLAAEQKLVGWELHFVAGSDLYPVIQEVIRLSGARTVGVEFDSLTYNDFKLLQDTLEDVKLTACDADFVKMRAVKTVEEIALIEKAQRLNETALSKVFSLMKPKMTERELYAEYMYQAMKLGADGFAFDPIVAVGASAAEPHHKLTDTVVGHNDAILFDVGVKIGGYCSDLSRTVCVGTPSKEMQKIYDNVLKAQEYSLSKIKAGITCNEADSFARERLTANGYGEAFGHSLGHGVGLDIHEFPRVARNVDVVLQPNMVITVEPGVYVSGVGGVRIEDTVVVTENGVRNLTSLHKKFQI